MEKPRAVCPYSMDSHRQTIVYRVGREGVKIENKLTALLTLRGKRLSGQHCVALIIPIKQWRRGVSWAKQYLYYTKYFKGYLLATFSHLYLSLALSQRAIWILRNPLEPLSVGPTRSAHLLCHRSIKPLKINWLLQKRCKVLWTICTCLCLRLSMWNFLPTANKQKYFVFGFAFR